MKKWIDRLWPNLHKYIDKLTFFFIMNTFTRNDILLGYEKILAKFRWPLPYFQGHFS